MEFTTVEIALILIGAAAGGFVSGLTGFGLALTAVPIWVTVLPPPLAGALGAGASVLGQIQTLPMVWQWIDWRRAAPFVLAGLVGVPLGTLVLPLLDARLFKLGVGLVLVGYCSFQLLAARLAHSIRAPDSRLADAAVGFGGGIMGGIAGLSGPLPIIWSTFKPWTRDEKRGFFQAFNTIVLVATVISSASAGLLPVRFWHALLLTVPVMLVSVQLGMLVYRRLDDRRFDRLVVTLLMLMGLTLVATSI